MSTNRIRDESHDSFQYGMNEGLVQVGLFNFGGNMRIKDNYERSQVRVGFDNVEKSLFETRTHLSGAISDYSQTSHGYVRNI